MFVFRSISGLGCAVILSVLVPANAQQGAGEKQGISRGEYLFRIAGCTACHTDRESKGPRLAGGRALNTPFGTFYSPNITPDRETGIGAWTDAQFLRALKAGIAPDGSNYYPSFPYLSYANMRREDVLAIKEYLSRQPPVVQRNRDHDLAWYMSRVLISPWKWWYFGAEDNTDKHTARKDQKLQRGAYIANALAHCGECHTPRDIFGGPDLDRRFAGTATGPDDESVPNITSDKETGIGGWSDSELKQYLNSGMTPTGDFAGGAMAEVIDNGLKYLRDDDLDALVHYIRSVPKVSNRIGKPRAKKQTSEWE